jgi:hypothetical protein
MQDEIFQGIAVISFGKTKNYAWWSLILSFV